MYPLCNKLVDAIWPQNVADKDLTCFQSTLANIQVNSPASVMKTVTSFKSAAGRIVSKEMQ